MFKKNIITNELLDQVKGFFDQNIGSRKIAEQLSITRWFVQQIYKELNIYDIGRKTPRYAYKATEKICKICSLTKSVNEFRKRVRKKDGRISYECYCFNCEKHYINERHKSKIKIRRKTDPNFRIRKSISYSIWKSLNNSNTSKNNESCMKHLNYSFLNLKNHLENKFESWMTWDNYGSYNVKTWNDNDQSTWKWQIDHIIPQSTLPYLSMKDENFKKCWSIDNLRPLNAKQNLLDGVNKIRHKQA